MTAMKTYEKFCFPLAKEQKNWKMLFSHTAGSLGASLSGGGGGGIGLTWLPVVCENVLFKR